MYMSLFSFGKELRDMRIKLGLTQNDVSTLTGINTDTLRRIEGGKVMPKFETLSYLSAIYKHDLNTLFLKYRFNDFDSLYELKNKLESKFDRDEFYTLNTELKELNSLIRNIHNSYFKDYLTQLTLLTDAVILYKDEDKYKEAIERLIKAIIITLPTFDLDNYKSLVYSPMEMRILMNIAFVLNKMNNDSMYLEILEFCIKSVDEVNEMYPKLCYNLAGAYTR
ncbi:helix-turn-helix domain-containing protein [Tissierella carlieri]|uniref:helix-turn-helix domain-containing protein n=1 Tax=Tissierella carlieri TaxID=689904 RepID=UPI00386FD1E6